MEVRSVDVISSQKRVHGVNVLLLQSVHLKDRVQLRETEAEVGLRKLNKKEHSNGSVIAWDLAFSFHVTPPTALVDHDGVMTAKA